VDRDDAGGVRVVRRRGAVEYLQRNTGSALFELHVLDLLNPQLPSSFDYTSTYDLLVFRRLAAVVPADLGNGIGEGLPPIHSRTGFSVATLIVLALGIGMSFYFWRKRYLGRP
jgi:hypothetical protein